MRQICQSTHSSKALHNKSKDPGELCNHTVRKQPDILTIKYTIKKTCFFPLLCSFLRLLSKPLTGSNINHYLYYNLNVTQKYVLGAHLSPYVWVKSISKFGKSANSSKNEPFQIKISILDTCSHRKKAKYANQVIFT